MARVNGDYRGLEVCEVITLRFTRGASLYQIAPAYADGEGYIGLCDGRVVARAMDRATVALALIKVPFAIRTRQRVRST
ncbi:MAG: hypothetical protein ACHP7A_07370 [Caulobacterales bacterium]|jgi:hypothetical protein